MVSINKNIFLNQDNGLSLSNSNKNTDELFAELFAILQSSDNLTTTNIETESIVGKSENNLKNDFVTENTYFGILIN